MSRAHLQRHLDDGQLVRLLGGELAAAEQARAEAHLGRCSACARSLEEMRATRETVRALIDEIAVPPMDPERRARSLAAVRAAGSTQAQEHSRTRSWTPVFHQPLARAAAVASLLFATALAATTTPARGWIAGLWHDLTDGPAVEAPRGTAEPLSARSSVVAFTPRGRTLTVAIGPQGQGALTVRVGESPTASVRLVGGDGLVDVTVLPASLEIDNRPEEQATYTVTVPATLERLMVRIGDDRVLTLRPQELGAGWETTYTLMAQ